MKNKPGKLIAASLGPGDPGLITREAWSVLKGGSCWLYPVKKTGAESYALDIVKRAGLSVPEDALALAFPMTHDISILSKYWLEAAKTVIEILKSGRDAVFLVEGDASTYSTFGHLARTINAIDETLETKVIAGVTSFSAAASCLNKPLTEADDTMAIIPAGYGVKVVEKMLLDFDTLVLMKVKPIMEDLLDLIEKKKLLHSSYFIERAGTPDEQIVTDLLQLRQTRPHYLSLLVIHNPHREHGEIIRGCGKKK